MSPQRNASPRRPLYSSPWREGAWRASALATLLLREGSPLDSAPIRKLLPGTELYVLETLSAGGSVRALVSDSPLAEHAPLGWVTAVSRDGVHLLDALSHEAAHTMRTQPHAVLRLPYHDTTRPGGSEVTIPTLSCPTFFCSSGGGCAASPRRLSASARRARGSPRVSGSSPPEPVSSTTSAPSLVDSM